MEGVFDHETPNNAVPSNSDQGHHVASAPPEMEKGPEAGQSQGFDLSELSYELKQAYRVFVELLSDSNRNVTWPFLDPVDAKAQGLWDYHERIKEPMSFAKSKCGLVLRVLKPRTGRHFESTMSYTLHLIITNGFTESLSHFSPLSVNLKIVFFIPVFVIGTF